MFCRYFNQEMLIHLRQIPLLTAILALTGLITCTPARADSLNGTPAGLYDPSADLTIDWAAESFTVTTQFLLSGAEFFTNEYTPLWDGTLDYGVFAGNGNVPGNILETNAGGRNPVYTTTVVAVDTGFEPSSIVQYDFLLKTPLTLAPGTYWIGLHLHTGYGYPDVEAWDSTTTPHAQISASAPGGDFSNWQPEGLQLALGVTGTPVSNTPEPASLALGGFGLAYLSMRCRRLARPRSQS